LKLKIRNQKWLIVAVVLLAFALRIYQLDEQSLRGDEAASATYASFSIAEIAEISRVADPHPPLFYDALHLWQILTGSTEFALRFWVLFPGALAVPSLFALLRRLIGPVEAIFAAFLLAINSFHIYYSQDLRSYTWLVLLGLWASYFLWQALHRGRRFDWGVYTLSLAFLFYLHYYSLFILAFHGGYVLWRAFSPSASLRTSFQLSAFSGQQPALSEVEGAVSSRRSAVILIWTGAVLLAALSFLPWLSASWKFVAGFTGDFAPALPQVVLWRGLQTFSGGLMVPTPRLAAWAGLGYFAVSGRRSAVRRRSVAHWLAMGALVLIVAGNLNAIYRYHSDPALAKSPQWRQLFEHIFAAQDPAADALIYNFPEASITYYLDTRRGEDQADLPAFLVPGQPNPPAAEIDAHLSQLLRSYQRVWFTPVDIAGWDDDKAVETWLLRHADRVDRADFHWIRADLYLTPAAIETSMTRQPVKFSNGIQLRGFQIFNQSENGQISLSDAPLDISLYWTTGAPSDIPLKVFVQLIDSTGFLRGAQDNQPVAGSYPTTHWQPREKITDKYRVALQPDAPSGAYQVWVGLYNPKNGERVMVLDDAGNPADDHIVLEVSPVAQ